MPNYHGYETTIGPLRRAVGRRRTSTPAASRPSATDPALPGIFEWQKAHGRRRSAATTSSRSTGRRSATSSAPRTRSRPGRSRCRSTASGGPDSIADANVDFNWGVAPFPVPDDQADTYGKGYLSGTIIGISSKSDKQNAAWEFVKYLTTNTDAVVSFANAIHNVPSTFERLKSPDFDHRTGTKTFVEIAQNPNSNTTPASPNGGAYQLTLQDIGYGYESGKLTDLQQGSERPAANEIDTDIAQVAMSSTSSDTSVTLRAKRRRDFARNVAFLSPWLLGTGLFFLYPLVSTVYFSFTKYDGFRPPVWNGLDNWTYVFQQLPVLLAGAAQHAVVRRRDGDAAGDLRARPSECWSRRSRPAPGCSARSSTCRTWRRR